MLTISQDNSYNIPVSVWLEESYPQSSPIVYVRPTQEMMIVKRTFISSNGEVLLPYLEDASLFSLISQGECDLVSLLLVIAAMFGECPHVGWLQFHREHDIYSRPDGSSYLSVSTDDGQPAQ